MSFFNTNTVAEGYSKDRPYLHPEIIQRVKLKLKLSNKVGYALDVGCGAGLSTIALKEVAKNIVGVDSSEKMIKSAIQSKNIEYFNYPAEHLPFRNKFDLVTVAGALNWINRQKFFTEAKNILSKTGVIIVYDIYILGVMEKEKKFKTWYINEYLKRYPKPPRDESQITSKEAMSYGLEFDSEDYNGEAKFTLDSYIKYMFTQSNITTAINNKVETSESIKKWFASSLVPFFGAHEKTLKFGGYIWYLRNVN
jgi:ubiquinone/menaquinone biosynthesis C-methylase UbiE